MSVANIKEHLDEKASQLFFSHLQNQTTTLSATAAAPIVLPSSASIDITFQHSEGVFGCVLSTMYSEEERKNSIKEFLSFFSGDFPKKNGNPKTFLHKGKHVTFLYEIDLFFRINNVKTWIRSASITSGDPKELSIKILDECLQELNLPRQSSGPAPAKKIIPWENIVSNSASNNAAKP